ncbi:AAA family ATPase [Deinococcus roseus]|uniref:Kinase n=1 Tax=Deinococcus roseus TaxID=392414 RepID=A0ABQ2D2Y0_9DEIO|nr:AAA family ATPase [Deinococcus roseus]GGJ41775.1 hypothetical protein GCM10008938_29810 [Deinococcus roseus]
MDIVLLMGLQASGKTSFYRQVFKETHVHISKDLWKNNKPYKQQKLLLESLNAGRSVVIDNTSPTREERAALIQTAKTREAKVIGYYFQSRLQDCLERNQNRDRQVPALGLYATFKKLQLPSLEEGFEALFYVELAEGTFVVSPWEEP